MIDLPRIPSLTPISYRFLKQAVVDLTAATTTQNINLVQVPAGYVVVGVEFLPIVRFTGTALASLTVSIGTSTSPTAYATPMILTGSVLTTSVQTTSPFTVIQTDTHQVIARFVSTGANLNAASAGKVEIVVNIRPV